MELFRLLRPVHWLKNGFVFIGILFGKSWNDPYLWMEAFLVAVAFSLVSSAVYIFNDIWDIEKDRLHPKKKLRPLASGSVSLGTAIVTGVIVLMAGLGLGAYVNLKVPLILSAYIALNILYTLRLKDVVILDVFCIAAGFLLRILAGTKGIDIPPSKWLVICSLMVTLFLGFSKRRAELLSMGHNHKVRKVLANYTPALLDELTIICASGVIITYSLYTMSPETVEIHGTERLIYSVPVLIYGIFRYLWLVQRGYAGEDPSKDILKDKHLMAAVVIWVVLVIYLIDGYDLTPNLF
jgi:4-hydroxybenzoate polyprenyltransferase